MREPSITTKIGPDALAQLRLIAQHTGERQIRALSRLVAAEAARLGLKAPRASKRKVKL
jgi:hypothetical protein